MDDASRELLSINAANLAANLENVRVNEEILPAGNLLMQDELHEHYREKEKSVGVDIC